MASSGQIGTRGGSATRESDAAGIDELLPLCVGFFTLVSALTKHHNSGVLKQQKSIL